MPLNQLQKDNIAAYMPIYQTYQASDEFQEDIKNREERESLYRDILSNEEINDLNEFSFGQVISSLWAATMWNPDILVGRLLRENNFETLKQSLRDLLWGQAPLEERFDTFREGTRYFGAATIAEILAFIYPSECGVWNNVTRQALTQLGFMPDYPFLHNAQISGEQYVQFNELLKAICIELENQGIPGLDLLGLNYFLFEVHNHEIEEPLAGEEVVHIEEEVLTDFDHDEAIEYILAIGQWLGFEVEKEKHIAPGSRVDAVWQTRIGNLGVVTYVFEVQRHGSRANLILNLQRAQNNPSVQRLIVVALDDELEHLKNEISTLPESFRRIVSYMDVAELLKANDLVSDLSQIIGRLRLVQSEFAIRE